MVKDWGGEEGEKLVNLSTNGEVSESIWIVAFRVRNSLVYIAERGL